MYEHKYFIPYLKTYPSLIPVVINKKETEFTHMITSKVHNDFLHSVFKSSKDIHILTWLAIIYKNSGEGDFFIDLVRMYKDNTWLLIASSEVYLD